MLGRLRRITNLYRLLWAEDRLDALEKRVDRVTHNHDARLRDLDAAIKDHSGGLREHVARLQEQLDMLKSSLEVPEELVAEYAEWRNENPIPDVPLVSVLVATCNRARVLTQKCIPSVLDQTYENVQLVVVGDNCTDETEELVAKIEDPRLTFVNLSERGVYPEDPERRWMVAGTTPTNKALSMAEGDFISHLDDDDEYFPDRLEKLVAFAIQNDCDFVWHPFWWEDDTDSSWTLHEALNFAPGEITNASAFYRGWFKRFDSEMHAYKLMEPGDWNRFRKIKYIGPRSQRYPEPLLRKYR